MILLINNEIFAFLRFYQKDDLGNYLGKPCIYLHLGEEIELSSARSFLKKYKITPDFEELNADLSNNSYSRKCYLRLTNALDMLNLLDCLMKVHPDWQKVEYKPTVQSSIFEENSSNDTPINQQTLEKVKRDILSSTEDYTKLAEFYKLLKNQSDLGNDLENSESRAPMFFRESVVNFSENSSEKFCQKRKNSKGKESCIKKTEENIEASENFISVYPDEEKTALSAKYENINLLDLEVHKEATKQAILDCNFELLCVLFHTESQTNIEEVHEIELIKQKLFAQELTLSKNYLEKNIYSLLEKRIKSLALLDYNKIAIEQNISLFLMEEKEIIYHLFINKFQLRAYWYDFSKSDKPYKTDKFVFFESYFSEFIDAYSKKIFDELIANNSNIYNLKSFLEEKIKSVNNNEKFILKEKHINEQKLTHLEKIFFNKEQNHVALTHKVLKKHQDLPLIYGTNIHKFSILCEFLYFSRLHKEVSLRYGQL